VFSFVGKALTGLARLFQKAYPTKDMLSISKVEVSVDKTSVVRGVSLRVRPGELHVLMGPNGSGKSSLAMALAGHPQYHITRGLVTIFDENILGIPPDERNKRGLFVTFQKPPAIPGVPAVSLLRAALQARSEGKVAARLVRGRALAVARHLQLPENIMERELFVGFSGGEAKRMELATLLLLGATFAVLDEPDSGLDIDGMKLIAEEIQKLLVQHTGVLLITHNPRMLEYVAPTHIHVMREGVLVASGDIALARQIETEGFAPF